MRRPFLDEREEINVSECIKDTISNINQECRYQTENIPIHIIVPLSGRPSALEAFLNRFEELIANKGESLHLTIVNFPQNQEASIRIELEKILKHLGDRLPGTNILITHEQGDFSRGRGLQVGALKMHKPDHLLFFCDIDTVFDQNTLRRIRFETKQVRLYSIIYSI